MTTELFLRYTERLCTAQERKQVADWLLTCSDDELDGLLHQFWQKAYLPMPADKAQQLLQTILSDTAPVRANQPVPFMKRYGWKIALAACLAGIVFITALLFTGKKAVINTASTKRPPAAAPASATWRSIVNTESTDKKITLEDGTRVQLAGHSQITYPAGFSDRQRTVYLQGRGLFNVAKDKQRPFTVYSGTISTTALGTIFEVTAPDDKKMIRVKLTEGRVVVRYNGLPAANRNNAVYLLPGQELVYDANRMSTTVNKPVAVAAPALVKNNNARIKPLKDISFTNAPLPEVLEQLHQRYHQPIQYNKEELAGLYFTGSITAGDSLNAILKIISTMNGLVTEQQANGFSIKKSR